MADALKDIYTETFLQDFAHRVGTAYPAFLREEFVASVLASPWEDLALRARMLRIATQLGAYLPSKYEETLTVLFAIYDQCTGFDYLFFPDFVAIFGLSDAHWELSMEALARFTRHSSSEFAIRPFILKDPERAMRQMGQWALHANEHVRRLSSEGCRPRLPWSVDLPLFKKDPAPILEILEKLKADPSVYVRKSVANNLNDISKDNPELVLAVVEKWQGSHPHTDWILRQGCRTLIKKANPKALELFGYAKITTDELLVKSAALTVEPGQLAIGDSCTLSYAIDIDREAASRIRLEYGIDFIKANGKPSRKLFFLAEKTVTGKKRLTGTQPHSFAQLSTRRHYPGIHRVVLLINGQEIAETTLLLQESFR